MPVVRLTQTMVKSLSVVSPKTTILYDNRFPGFGLRMTRKGAKSFILNYRIDGQERRLTIGSFPQWSLAAAREEAAKLRRRIDTGEDPLAEREKVVNIGQKTGQYVGAITGHLRVV